MDKWEKRDNKLNKRRSIKNMNAVHKDEIHKDKETEADKYRRDLTKLMKAMGLDEEDAN